MAQGRPWYKRSGGDFVMATLSMPDSDTKWAYSAIIDMLNDRDRPLADDAAFIVGFTGLTKQKWGRVRSYLISHGYLTLTPDGRLTNPRFERECAERDAAHEEAVKAGRAGGRKSAAMRAAGQGDLDLGSGDIGENLEKTGHVSSKKVASLLEQTGDIEKQKAPETAKPVQPPPQAPRGREEARGESIESNPTTVSLAVTAPPGSSSGDDQGPGLLARADLYEKLQAVQDASGYRPVSPGKIAAAMAVVKDWHERGIDFDKIIIPTLKAVVADSTEPTGSLSRFRARIDHEVARAEALNGKTRRYRPPASPIIAKPDEPPIMETIRAELLERMGSAAYCLAFNDLRFEDCGDERGKRPLRVHGPAHVAEAARHGNYAPTLKAIIRPHGFTEVW